MQQGCLPSVHKILKRGVLVSLLACGLAGCASSPTGRSQVLMYSPAQMAELGEQSFSQLKQQQPVVKDARTRRYVQCVADAVTSALPAYTGDPAVSAQQWEVVVFDSPEVNAFALPGGKIGVYSGLLKVAENQDQLATVIGHEVSHVLAQHSNERLSRSQLAALGMNIAGSVLGEQAYGQEAMAALGLGVQVGVLLPYGRAQESEADDLGLTLMAQAGFDPRQAVILWQRMAAQEGTAPVALLSTHPSSQTRISQLQAWEARALPLMQQAHAAGRRPQCKA